MKLEKKVYETSPEKRKDLFLGVGVLIGLNMLLYLIVWIVTALIGYIKSDISSIKISLWFLFPLLSNIVVLIYFYLTRSWIALGMLATFGATLALGLITAAACFILLV